MDDRTAGPSSEQLSTVKPSLRGPKWTFGVQVIVIVFCLATLSYEAPRISKLLLPFVVEKNGTTIPPPPGGSKDTVLSLWIPDKPDRSIQERISSSIGNSTTSPLSHCNVTSQVQIVHSLNETVWILHALDDQGQPKHVGGDEFYITYTDDNSTDVTWDPVHNRVIQHPTSVALIQDLENGMYRLEFVSPPMANRNWTAAGQGYLTIHFVYTCGVAQITLKDDWKDGGYSGTVYAIHAVPSPPTRDFVPPTIEKPLSEYDHITVFGDSIMGQFVGQYWQNPDFRGYGRGSGFPSNKKMLFRGNVRSTFSLNKTDYLKETFTQWHGAQLQDKLNTAVLMGSGPWDLGVITWSGGTAVFPLEPILAGYREFIEFVRQQFPNTTVLWKSQSAVHAHNSISTKPKIIQGTKYAGRWRTEQLDMATRKLMKELNVPLLDIYEATFLSADWLFPEDGGHYKFELNRAMLNWFYSKSR